MNIHVGMKGGEFSRGWDFLFVAASGLIAVYAFSILLADRKIMNRLWSIFGKYSFEIMALQFLCFKPVIYIYNDIS